MTVAKRGSVAKRVDESGKLVPKLGPGPEGAERSTPSGSGRWRNAIRGRRAQKACPCPRLFNVNPFGVPKAAGMEANRTLRGTAFEAAPLIKPPALRGVSDLQALVMFRTAEW